MILSRSVVLVAVVVLAGCTTTPNRQAASGGPTPAVSATALVDAIHAEVAEARSEFDAGLRTYRQGDAEAARRATAHARERLQMAALRCLRVPGCEVERVVSAMDGAVAASTGELLNATETTGDATVPEDQLAAGADESPLPVNELPEAARAVRLLKGRDLGEIIQLNAPIKSALEDWLTWKRSNLIEAYENYQYLRAAMWPAYQKADLPEALLFAMLATESGGKVHAYSRAGAAGPLQFMYATGLRYGLGSTEGFDTRYDPAAAARANVAYMNDQLRNLNDNLELALAAYNGGEGRVGRLAGAGNRSFWEAPIYYSLPPETREYVPVVLAAAYLFLHPEMFNLRFPVVDARTAEVTLKAPLSLNELSVCLGQDAAVPRGWFRQVRNLNPRFEPNDAVAAGTRLTLPQAAAAAYEQHCVSGPMVAVVADLHAAQVASAGRSARNATASRSGEAGGKGGRHSHTVRKGETLNAIARKFGCRNIQPLVSANGLRAPHYAIRAGQKLVVPSCRA